MTLRPYAAVIGGELVVGVEIEVDSGGTVTAIGPHTGLPDPYVLSPAFVNAHSHLEYRGLQGKIEASGYMPWIREITRLKPLQTAAEVEQDCRTAALENRLTGVAAIAEHTDRPGAALAMAEAGLAGRLYQEVITFNEAESPAEKLRVASERAAAARKFGYPCDLNPHAPHTVDRATLQAMADLPALSIHVAETAAENEFFLLGSGAIADLYDRFSVPYSSQGLSVVAYLDSLGLAKPGVQFVHLCAVSPNDIALISRKGVSVAHCPRSNQVLGCPPAPIRECLDAGIPVGLGLDSAASSGPIDLFAEMRSALSVSRDRGRPVTAAEVWRMSTSLGAASLGLEGWDLTPGSKPPLIGIEIVTDDLEDLVERATPGDVKWIDLTATKSSGPPFAASPPDLSPRTAKSVVS